MYREQVDFCFYFKYVDASGLGLEKILRVGLKMLNGTKTTHPMLYLVYRVLSTSSTENGAGAAK